MESEKCEDREEMAAKKRKKKHQRIEVEIERKRAARHIHSNQPANEH